MTKSEPLATVADIAESLALLTRLPLRSSFARGARAAWAWPLAGLVVAGLAALVGVGLHHLGLPAPLAAGLALAAQIAATGGLHEDGLADSADGLWGGADPTRRLEIMRDSHIGSYGALALGLGLILRWSALSTLLAAGWFAAPLLAAAALSRAPMAVLAAALPQVRTDGLARSVGRPRQDTASLAVIVALLAAFALVGWGLLAPVLWATLASIALAALARAKLGGQTGDILGASQQVAEIASLCAFAAIA